MAVELRPIVEQNFRESIATKKSQAPQNMQLKQQQNNEQHNSFTLPEVKEHLDNVLRDTSITYSIDENENDFIIKVLDKETDKIIKEIPSKDIQVLRKHFKDHLGVLFNELI